MLWLVLGSISMFLIYYIFFKPLGYWKKRNIPYSKPLPVVGSFGSVLMRKKPFIQQIKDNYDEFPNERYNGIHQFTEPLLLVRDLELIKQITVKDFDYFVDHGAFLSSEDDSLLSKNLVGLKGQRWRDMRATLSPTFTSSKMRAMFNVISECAEQFANYFKKQDSDLITVEMKESFTRYTNDVIASAAFGFKCDSLENPTNEFYTMGKSITNLTTFRKFVAFGFFFFPRLMQLLRFEIFPSSMSNFFRRIVKETMDLRENEGLVRQDLIHILMEAQKGNLQHEEQTVTSTGFATVEEADGKAVKQQKIQITEDDIVAQALIFFFAGFETTATLLSFLSYELALNPDAQKTLQEEIDITILNCNGKLTYEKLLGMKYLDMVISETLRKWPPGFQLDRLCVKDYILKPEKSQGKSVFIEKGTKIVIPVYGIHLDSKYFSNPHQFDPDRFSEANKANIIPYSFMPFGSGPRSCIASRFALLESKAIVFYLLAHFDLVVVDKTPIPLKVSTKNVAMAPDEGFWLGLRTRKTVNV